MNESEASQEQEVYEQIEAIVGFGVEFVEISGGSFENPRVKLLSNSCIIETKVNGI